MEIIDINVGVINTNCYIVTGEKETIVIDPGDDSDKIIEILEDKSLRPKLCILTHAHFDHVLAVVDIIDRYKIPLLLNKKDLFLLREGIDFEKVEKYIEFIDENSKVSLGNLSFQIIETPGHTPGSISLYCEDKKAIFVGDLIFAEGFVGRTDFEYSDESALRSSIESILTLTQHVHVYPGHGPSFLISDWRL